ncbi:hypothetical protein GCM10027174_32890 [Salinifilum aidingensis]
MSRLRRLLTRLTGGPRVPDEVRRALEHDERVLAAAESPEGAAVATQRGLWLPERRRVGWHLISKATWDAGSLSLVEAEEIATADQAVVLRDHPPRRLRLSVPGRVPQVVHERVTGSIRSRHRRDLPGGGAWVVQRRVPGQDGVVLQVRGDPGTDEQLVTALAREVSTRVRSVEQEGAEREGAERGDPERGGAAAE